ncbi:MAG: hypothetical protein KatS3mg117_2805 [Geminicoccaceae bacterium]|nr:MAG: hypothetical protein KatS3mg117_2805 [Geminicoccaceae bacterium]
MLALPSGADEPAARTALARLLLARPPILLRPPSGPSGSGPPFDAPAVAAPGSVPTLPPALLASLAEEDVRGWPLDHLPLAAPLGRFVLASPFGPRPSPFTGLPSRHEGVDLLAPPGTPVRAAAAGRVRSAGRDGPFGLAVELEHGGGLTTRYAHLARILVRPGAAVEVGQPVGLLGNSGRSTGPHLHYEVRLAGRPLDPMLFLEAGRLLALARAGPVDPGALDDGPIEVYGPIGLGGEGDPPT